MTRVLTAVVAIPVVLLITIFSPDWLFALVVGLVSAGAAAEFLLLAEKKGIGRPGSWFLVPAALVAVSYVGGPSWVLTALAVSTLSLMTVTVFSTPIDTALGRLGVGLASLVYCSVLLGFLVIMAREMILVLFAIIWAGDAAAYYGGRALGRHQLASRVSPKKTVEGAVVGLAGSVVAGVLLGMWLLGESAAMMIGVAAATAIAGQIGDLAESALKRSAGVKDSSSILPGHGGILDRLDSLFFAAPVFYWFFNS